MSVVYGMNYIFLKQGQLGCYTKSPAAAVQDAFQPFQQFLLTFVGYGLIDINNVQMCWQNRCVEVSSVEEDPVGSTRAWQGFGQRQEILAALLEIFPK